MREQSPEGTRESTDLALVRGALEGHGEAERALLLRLRCVPRMVVAQNRRLGQPLSMDAVEDVVQEALIAVWAKLRGFAGRAALETWIYPFCYFEFMRHVRLEGGRPRSLDALRSVSELEDPAQVGLTPEPDPWLHELEILQPEEAEILRLKHFDGCTFEGIAELLGISPNTAKTRYYRGLQRLRVRLAARLEPGAHGARRRIEGRVS